MMTSVFHFIAFIMLGLLTKDLCSSSGLNNVLHFNQFYHKETNRSELVISIFIKRGNNYLLVIKPLEAAFKLVISCLHSLSQLLQYLHKLHLLQFICSMFASSC